MWLWFVIPLFPISAKYRVLYQTPRRYASRKVNVVGQNPKAFVKPVLALAAIALVLYLACVSYLEKHPAPQEEARPQMIQSPHPAPHATSQKSAIKPCDRPSPLETKEQFLRLDAAFDKYIAEEKFSPQELDEMPHKDIEDLAAQAYNLAYLTAENPESEKADFFQKFNEKQTATKAYSDLP